MMLTSASRTIDTTSPPPGATLAAPPASMMRPRVAGKFLTVGDDNGRRVENPVAGIVGGESAPNRAAPNGKVREPMRGEVGAVEGVAAVNDNVAAHRGPDRPPIECPVVVPLGGQ